MKGQNIQSILKNMETGKKIDTIISVDKENFGYIPVSIIKGNNTDAIYTLVAGIHGYEYPPIVAMQELKQEIDAKKLNGSIIILPIANVASFYKRSPFVNPVDGKNLNNAFPGDPDGSLTQRIAYWISKEIIPISDVFIDIHGGDASEDLLPFICYYDNKDAQTKEAKQLCEASEMEYIISYPFNITKTEPAKYAFKQAAQDGKVALSIEAGKLGNVQKENVDLIKDAVYKMLDYSNLYKNEQVKEKHINRKFFSNQTYIRVPVSGLFYSFVKSGDKVTKNENLGYITDVFGKILQKIDAPVEGVVLYKIGTPPVNKGETLFCIGY